MLNEYIKTDRFEAYKASLATNMTAAKETAVHCVRLAKKGHNVAVIIGWPTEIDSIRELVISALGGAEIILCNNGAPIRIFPQNVK